MAVVTITKEPLNNMLFMFYRRCIKDSLLIKQRALDALREDIADAIQADIDFYENKLTVTSGDVVEKPPGKWEFSAIEQAEKELKKSSIYALWEAYGMI